MDSSATLTSTDLIHQYRNLQFPFSLKLEKNDGQLYCEIPLRVLPGRRISCFGTWRGQPVFAKLFFNRNAKKHWQRELDGYQAIKQTSCFTPKMLYAASTDHEKIYIILFKKIPGATPFQSYWPTLNDQQKQQILLQLTTILKEQHIHGILQSDLYFDNFIIANNKIYCIDCGGFTQHKKPLAHQAALKNLAQLLIHTKPLTQPELQNILATYNHPEQPSPQEFSQLIYKTKQQHDDRVLKKIYRNCSEFVRKDEKNEVRIYRRDHQQLLHHLLDYPDATLKYAHIIKRGNSSTVGVIKLQNKSFVIKRYNIKNWRHFLSRCWRPSRAWRSWYNAHMLQLIGINTPKPIAIIEKRFGFLRHKAYYITEYIPGETLDTITKDSPNLQSVINSITSIFHKLAYYNIHHGDMKATNFIMHNSQLFLVDLDAVKKYNSTKKFSLAFTADKMRFLENWHSQKELHKLFQDALT